MLGLCPPFADHGEPAVAAPTGPSPGLGRVPPAGPRLMLREPSSGGGAVGLGCLGALGFVVVPVICGLLGVAIGVFSPVAGWVVAGLVALGLWTLLGWGVLRGLRAAAWLEHTTLVVRGAVRTRRCDLATARVTLDSVPETTTVSSGQSAISVPTGRRLPRLVAYDARTGRSVRLMLVERGNRGWLWPHKLRALADAVLAAPRPQPEAAWAWRAAATLRAMAGDPTGSIR